LFIDDSGLDFLAYFKKLMSLRFNTVPGISSARLLSVAVGCRRLSSLHLTDCKGVSSAEWLEYLGRVGSLEELVVKYSQKICQYDLLKFGPGWMKLQKFEFQRKGWHNIFDLRDPSYVPNYQYTPCSFGLSATSQQYFSLRTNQPPAISQQYFSLRTNQHQPSATNQTNRMIGMISSVSI
jgi:hypothetical protein